MSSDSGEIRRQARPQNHVGGPQQPPPPPETEQHLRCPRCNSTNTKFCYYNNYNLSQPRHFCKSCRRYWTQGGTLRNIPFGGGTRKNSRRSRASSSNSETTHDPIPATPISVSAGVKPESGSPLRNDVNLNENVSGSFTSLLNSQGPGFVALGGFGVGLGPGFDEIGFGLGRSVWSYPEVGEVGGGGGGSSVGDGGASVAASGCNTWQINGVEGGLADGDCFGWPDLAISMPGKGLK